MCVTYCCITYSLKQWSPTAEETKAQPERGRQANMGKKADNGQGDEEEPTGTHSPNYQCFNANHLTRRAPC